MSSERSSYNNLSLTALAIGVPVLVGASYYYLYHTGNKNNGDDKNNSKDKGAKKLSPLEELMHLKQIGNHNFSRKKYDIAIEHYTKAIELNQTLTPAIKSDDLAIFYQNRAACNEALGHLEKVLIDCNEAIKLKPTYTKAYLRRAKAYEKSLDYEKAMVDAFCATLLEKFQNQTSMTFADNIVRASSKLKATEAMKAHVPCWPSNQTIKNYFSAFSLDPVQELHGGPIIVAEQIQPIFENSLKEEYDEDPVQLLVRGSCYSLMGQLTKVHESFEKLLSFDEDKCPARVKANALLKKAALVITEPSMLIESANEKEYEKVFELIEQALKLDPENPDIYLHKAQALTLTENLKEAVKTLERALELKKDYYPAFAQKLYFEFKLAMSESSFSNKKAQEISDKFAKAVKENPNSQDLQQTYAQVLTEIGLFEQADKVFSDLCKQNPLDGSYLVSRALVLFQLKSDEEQVSILLKEALKIDPKIIYASEILGSIAIQYGKLDEGIKVFENALKYACSQSDYERCYSLLDSTKSQKAAAELLGM